MKTVNQTTGQDQDPNNIELRYYIVFQCHSIILQVEACLCLAWSSWLPVINSLVTFVGHQ
jgi:hypothetical protein